ncbi:hypothetical protein HHK36_017333 [Tetracentron sinense]|nr:hypothetical protein HHK36_017333 [Tetracentron sinense]
MGGLMSMHEHNIMTMCMDSSTFSSSSVQAMAPSNGIDPSQLLDNSYNMSDAAGYFNVSTCLTQVGMGDGLYEGHGFLGGANMGLQGELFVPPLENISIEESAATDNNINNTINCNNNYQKVENKVGVGNYWEGENLRMGEWDLESLIEDVSPFLFLDFQVE